MCRLTLSMLVLVGVSLFMTDNSFGQTVINPVSEYQIASDQLDEILAKSDEIRDLRKRVRVRSRAANLLWGRDPEESRRIFSKLWKEIDTEPDNKSFDKEDSRIDLLEQLYPRDRALANRLVKEAAKSGESSDPLHEKVNGTNSETRRLAFLSYRMVEENVAMAAAVLEASLAENTAPSLPLVLNRIRETNPVLANYVVANALDRFQNQPPTLALFGLGHLTPYLFPMSPSPYISPDAAESDETLRQQYFSTAYAVLKQSLMERDEDLIKIQKYSQQTLNLRKFLQATVTGILVALSPRYSAEYFVELNTLNIALMQEIPKQLSGLISMQVAAVNALIGSVEASELSDAEIISAISKEDFFTAERLINNIREEIRKKAWSDILFRSQAKSLLKRGDHHLALSAARKIENPVLSIPIIVEISKLAGKKKDETVSIMALQAAESISEKLKKGMQAKIGFSIAAEIAYLMPAQASAMIQTSVETVNGLSEIKDEKISYTGENYWSNPDNFLTASHMIKAFALSGELNLSDTLLMAHKFRDNSLQMMAKLATIERVLRKGPPKVKSEKRPTKSSKPE